VNSKHYQDSFSLEIALMSELSLIPQPQKIVHQKGSFHFSSRITIVADFANRENATYLKKMLAPIPKISAAPGQKIKLSLGLLEKTIGKEGYQLKITPKEITIQAASPTGVLYGIQTLRQLLPAELENGENLDSVSWEIPCVEITDRPRFAWRGFMLDEGRHFLGKAAVLRLLDLMALHKLNVFHWHLTEDQGWRIEIKKYPLLTKVGSKRAGTGVFLINSHDYIPHGGFYTQQEIKEIVAYAADRHILIVPEIEMPGHSLAALAAYPELSCTGGPFEVATHFGIFPDIYCAGKDRVFAFL
jgi:hexosaminidase